MRSVGVGERFGWLFLVLFILAFFVCDAYGVDLIGLVWSVAVNTLQRSWGWNKYVCVGVVAFWAACIVYDRIK